MPALTTIDSFLTMGFSLLLMQVNKLPFIKSINIYYLYGVFFVFQAINFSMLYYIKVHLERFIDHRKLKLKIEPSFFSQTAVPEEEELTFSQYDDRELKKAFQSSAINFLMGTVMGLYFKSVHPLFSGILNVPKALFLNPLYIAHIFKWEIKRPYSENRAFEFGSSEEPRVEEVKEGKKYERKIKDE